MNVEKTLDVNQVAQNAISLVNEKLKTLKTLNIIVAGKTGVGKSTLINSVFREKLAETGTGKPVTAHMRQISKQDVPLTVYDTQGFELNEEHQQHAKQEIMDKIRQQLATNDISQMIHCIWYCISTASHRVEPEEIEWLREISKENRSTKVPIIVVLTQSFSQKDAAQLKQAICNENLDVVQVIPVLAEDYEIDEEYIAKAYGLDVLIRVMGEVLPEELLDTLQNVQIANLAEKQKRARGAVVAATAAAAAIGLSPIPFSDCALLIPTQITMIASITAVFGFEVNKSMLASFLSSALGTGGATILGKTVVSGLLKCIPGAGSIAGGVISAATAGTLTTALGEAYIKLMTLMFKGEMSIDDLGTKSGKQRIKSLFKQELKKQSKSKQQ